MGVAAAAEDSFLVPFGLGPEFDGVVGQCVVAVFAGVVDAAAFHFDGDDVQRGLVMDAAGLRIEIQPADFRNSCGHWIGRESG